jgi:hypothetical protein
LDHGNRRGEAVLGVSTAKKSLTHKIAVATIAGNLEFSSLFIKDARRNYKP